MLGREHVKPQMKEVRLFSNVFSNAKIYSQPFRNKISRAPEHLEKRNPWPAVTDPRVLDYFDSQFQKTLKTTFFFSQGKQFLVLAREENLN